MNNKDPKGYYAILGVAANADAGEIKATYRRKAMEIHPDRNKAANATEQFQLLNEAYGVLSDPVTRAQYDTMSIDSGPQASAEAKESPEPMVCSCCGKVTAQPRYAIFFEIKSYIFQTTRSAIQGIFCSACAEKKAFKASAITWLFGWWGIPWGPIYSLQAIFTNMFGGKQPANINARLAAHQAWVFALLGKTDIARAIAFDALALAKKIKPDTAYTKTKKKLGYDVTDEGTEIRKQIGTLLELLGNGGSGNRLKDAWGLFRRPFYAQAVVACAVFGWGGYSIATAPPSQPPKGPKPYISQPQNYVPQQPAYVRSAVAPNGQPWPTVAGYVNGFPYIHSDGLSEVTVDNSQNDSDVFVKLVSLDGPNAFPVRVFFIPARGSFTLDSVTAGSYDIRYQDLDTGGLSRSEHFSLEEIPTNNGTQYSNLTMTLYKVSNGNMHTYELSKDEF
jgi:hypothetical protein